MTQFLAFDSRVEVNGETVLSVMHGVGPWQNAARRILEQNGISDPRPGEWYPQQSWLDAFMTISEIGGRTLQSIGRSIPENAQWPPEIDSVKAALASIDAAYHMNHRRDGRPLLDPETGEKRPGIGCYAFRDTGERSAVIVCENPYPCSFDHGIVSAIARRFAEDADSVDVSHGPTCRKSGAAACSFTVTW